MHLLALCAQLLVAATILGSPTADFDSRESDEVPYRRPVNVHRPRPLLPSYPQKGLIHRLVASLEDSREDFSDEQYYPSRPLPVAGAGYPTQGQDPYPAAFPKPIPLPVPQPQPLPQPYPVPQPTEPQPTAEPSPTVPPSQPEPYPVQPTSPTSYPAPVATEVANQDSLRLNPKPSPLLTHQGQGTAPLGVPSSSVISDPAKIPSELAAYIAAQQKRYARDYSAEFYFNPASRPGVKYHYGQSPLYIRDQSGEDSDEVGILPVLAIQGLRKPVSVQKQQGSINSAAAYPLAVGPAPVHVPAVPSFEDILASTREGNARVDAILQLLATKSNSLSKINLKINELPSTLRIHRWAYRSVPFSFRIPEHPLYGSNTGESFETVDDDYLTRIPVAHPTQDGVVEYHMQLVEEDNDDFLRLFHAGLLPQAVKLTKRSSGTVDEEPSAAKDPAPANEETVQVQPDAVPPTTDSALVQEEVVPPQTEQVSAVEEAVPVENDKVLSEAGGVPAQGTVPLEAGSTPDAQVPATSPQADDNAILTGLNAIRRTSNVRVFEQHGTKSIHAPVLVGPLELEILDSTSTFPRGTKVLSRPMKSILALEETEGKITSLQLYGARRMALHYSQVTLSRSAQEGQPDWTTAGRLVTHLSLEMAHLWNQGSLVDQVNNELKGIAQNSGIDGYQKNKYY